MGLFGHLLGKTPPKVPTGGRAFASDDNGLGTNWTIRVVTGDQDPTPNCPRLAGSPSFKHQTTAYAYLDWLTGDAKSFEYPPGEA